MVFSVVPCPAHGAPPIVESIGQQLPGVPGALFARRGWPENYPTKGPNSRRLKAKYAHA